MQDKSNLELKFEIERWIKENARLTRENEYLKWAVQQLNKSIEVLKKEHEQSMVGFLKNYLNK